MAYFFQREGAIMENHSSNFNSLESSLESLIMAPLRALRQRLLGPFAARLARCGVSADMLSFAALIPASGFCVFAPLNFALAFWLMVLALALDGLDGVLARQTHTSSLGGAFTDMCCDLSVLTLLLAGLVWRGTLNALLALFFLFIYTFFSMFFVLHHLLHVSTRWLIRPGKSLLCIVVTVDIAFHTHLLNTLLVLYFSTLPLLGISFWRIKKSLA
jgi:phosphatidylglycerophosphate synthase